MSNEQLEKNRHECVLKNGIAISENSNSLETAHSQTLKQQAEEMGVGVWVGDYTGVLYYGS